MTTYRQIHGVRVVSLTSCQPFKDAKEATLAMTNYRQIHGVRVVSLTSCQPCKDVKETTIAITNYRQIHGVRVVSLTSCQPFKYLKKPLSHDPLLGKNIFSWVSTHEINLEIHWVSQFFGHTLFGENAKFPIFWSEIESQF